MKQSRWMVLAVAVVVGCNKEAPKSTDVSPSPSATASNAAPPPLPDAARGSISGKVILRGTPPAEKEIVQFQGDAACGKTRSDVPKTRLYVVGPAGELADTFVYVKEGLAGKDFPPPEKPVLLDQAGCEYAPYVFGIRTGQQLFIRNSDPVMHNVNVNSRAGNKSFNEAQMGKGPDKTKTFSNPELFLPFQCNVHPWMFAYACVVEHPFFAVTGKDGAFKLEGLPPGSYVIEAIHRKAGKATRTITVSNRAATLDFALEFTAPP